LSDRSTRSRFRLAALRIGVLVPFVYFGIQLIAAPFYPGYSFMNRDASTLGSAGSRCPAIFNLGSILLGMMTLIAAWGFFRALRDSGVNPILTWLISLGVASFGVASINAGIFPLPDPRHTTGVFAIAGIGSILLPFLMPVVVSKLHGSRPLRTLLLFNIVALFLLIPIVSGLSQYVLIKAGVPFPRYQDFLNHSVGLVQRILAFITIVPIGIGAYCLIARNGNRSSRTV
jgi:hypothetical membrane protein